METNSRIMNNLFTGQLDPSKHVKLHLFLILPQMKSAIMSPSGGHQNKPENNVTANLIVVGFRLSG
jgi:hypothetical protein